MLIKRVDQADQLLCSQFGGTTVEQIFASHGQESVQWGPSVW